ncbi:MAG: hypothetical protein V1918_04880 [Planctomycetota bacterium]
MLNLTPSVSEIAGWRPGSDRPIINTREITTTVKVNSGDTVLIAGLFKENAVTERQGVPGLQNVPGLGRLFSRDRKEAGTTEVVFLLRITAVR